MVRILIMWVEQQGFSKKSLLLDTRWLRFSRLVGMMKCNFSRKISLQADGVTISRLGRNIWQMKIDDVLDGDCLCTRAAMLGAWRGISSHLTKF